MSRARVVPLFFATLALAPTALGGNPSRPDLVVLFDASTAPTATYVLQLPGKARDRQLADGNPSASIGYFPTQALDAPGDVLHFDDDCKVAAALPQVRAFIGEMDATTQPVIEEFQACADEVIELAARIAAAPGAPDPSLAGAICADATLSLPPPLCSNADCTDEQPVLPPDLGECAECAAGLRALVPLAAGLESSTLRDCRIDLAYLRNQASVLPRFETNAKSCAASAAHRTRDGLLFALHVGLFLANVEHACQEAQLPTQCALCEKLSDAPFARSGSIVVGVPGHRLEPVLDALKSSMSRLKAGDRPALGEAIARLRSAGEGRVLFVRVPWKSKTTAWMVGLAAPPKVDDGKSPLAVVLASEPAVPGAPEVNLWDRPDLYEVLRLFDAILTPQ